MRWCNFSHYHFEFSKKTDAFKLESPIYLKSIAVVIDHRWETEHENAEIFGWKAIVYNMLRIFDSSTFKMFIGTNQHTFDILPERTDPCKRVFRQKLEEWYSKVINVNNMVALRFL